MTSTSIGSGEIYPGQSLSVSQLLYAAKKKLQDTCFSGRIATSIIQVDILEQDVLGVLSLIRSTKNSLVSINRIPPEVLSLVALHCSSSKDLITLTHICRHWRKIFISHASLWTNLDCTATNNTRVFLKRLKTSPLRIHLEEWFLNDAFLLTIPHFDRLETLSLSGPANDLLQFVKHLCSPSPILKTLSIIVTCGEDLVLQDSIFGGNLSSLHELCLGSIVTNLAWEDMSNLRTFGLYNVSPDKISVTQLLDFFERAPLLHEILLEYAFPDSSNAPPGRVVPLPNLKHLTITAPRLHTILMNHLLIPTGASITQTVCLFNAQSPIRSHLPRDLNNLEHLSNITSITLSFAPRVDLRFEGPSGAHCIFGDWFGRSRFPTSLGRWVLQSLDALSISAVEMLQLEHWQSTISSTAAEKSPIYSTFRQMDNLCALALIACLNRPFFRALNPKKNASRTVMCPKLEGLVVYLWRKERNFMNELLEMVKERAAQGAKLEAVMLITDADELLPAKEVLELRMYASHVQYRQANVMPDSDATPEVIDSTGDESDW